MTNQTEPRTSGLENWGDVPFDPNEIKEIEWPPHGQVVLHGCIMGVIYAAGFILFMLWLTHLMGFKGI